MFLQHALVLNGHFCFGDVFSDAANALHIAFPVIEWKVCVPDPAERAIVSPDAQLVDGRFTVASLLDVIHSGVPIFGYDLCGPAFNLR
ncbi:hypothetical protein ASC96_27890 [Rhizobium sp. Root1204]|nr:hypothetical protein ASC96_27890 [Rhizobium sp. Root1204]